VNRFGKVTIRCPPLFLSTNLFISSLTCALFGEVSRVFVLTRLFFFFWVRVFLSLTPPRPKCFVMSVVYVTYGVTSVSRRENFRSPPRNGASIDAEKPIVFFVFYVFFFAPPDFPDPRWLAEFSVDPDFLFSVAPQTLMQPLAPFLLVGCCLFLCCDPSFPIVGRRKTPILFPDQTPPVPPPVFSPGFVFFDFHQGAFIVGYGGTFHFVLDPSPFFFFPQLKQVRFLRRTRNALRSPAPPELLLPPLFFP